MNTQSQNLGWVVVEMKAVTLCGSDKGLYRGSFPFFRDPQQIAGHEGSGVVVETGNGVNRFHKGDRVILYHASGCGCCDYCRRGMVTLCKQSHGTYGFQRNGVLSKYVLAEEKDLIALPDGVSFEDAAPLACSFSSGYSAAKKLGISGRDAVFVSGSGPVGLGILMNAKTMGANPLLAADDNQYRRDLAQRIGIITDAFETSKAYDHVMEYTKGRGVEKSFDASGTTAGRKLAESVLREYCTAAFMGEGEEYSMKGREIMGLIHGERQITGSWAVSLWEIEELLELIERWNIHPADMITHRYSLQEIDLAFRTAMGEQCGKVAIVDFD